MTAWMRLYGEANDVRGLATGPIETRFARLRENTSADTLIVWTTPTRWAAGEGLSLRFPQLHLEFSCSLGDGHLIANKVAQVTEDARAPDREPGAVGVIVHPERVPLPPEDQPVTEPDIGVDTLERHFAQLAGKRWSGFAAPLRAALEAEAQEDEARTQRLTVPFKDASLTHGGEEDVWRLKGVGADPLRALDDGEWLEILDEQGRSRTSARVIDTHPSAGTLVVGVRTAADPPRSGFIRPRSRRKILEQKRALLDELASPTGSLPNLVRLVAAPASMPTPHQVRPERFVNPAVVRNRSQARAVSLALGLEDGQALLIQGPPGTGKSTTAAEIDVQLILRDPGVRILVCSHSNHGTDNMLMKVLPFLDDAADRIARIGFYERIAKEARPFYAAADADLGDRNIIFTTIDALVLQDVAGARVYDYVILDEANRAGVLDSLLALARGKRMILVGDPMQLQPVMSEAEQQIVAANNNNNSNNGSGGRHGRHGGRAQLVGVAQPGANNVIGKSLFAWIQERRFAPGAAVLLDQQNRMHPAIGELVSRVFYANRVRTGPAAPRRGTGLPAFPSPVTWVDTRSLRGNVESRAGGTSLFNVAEARLVTSITRNLASQAPPNLTIGVITAYAEQRDLLRRLMGPHDWPPERHLEIDTVDAFEGREKDIIVLSLVRANRRRDIGFLRLEQRLNVAISRSRRLLIIVGDTSTLRQGYFHHLVATAQQVGQIMPAPKLIGMFLSRGRRRQEREERRREGTPEEVAARADGEVTAAEEGVAMESEGGVAPTAAPGQETHVPSGSRRRRRRAWERRRERLRAMHEQAAAEGGEEPAEPGVNGVVPEEAAPAEELSTTPPDVEETGPVVRPRRPRRRREAPAEEAAVEPEPQPEIEPPPAKVKRTRKRVTEPVEVVAEVVEVVEVVEAKPARRARAKAAPAPEPVIEVVETKPARRSRKKVVEEPPPVVAEVVEVKRARRPRAKTPPAPEPVVEVIEAKPARRSRKKALEEEPQPVVVDAVEAIAPKPARRPRKKAVEVAEPPSVNGTVPEPLAAPAKQPRTRRTTRAS
ncbi:MAG TPA: AAA domain-containing protein [Chloroflexota bacterium]